MFHEHTVLLTDDALLAEVIDGKACGQEGEDDSAHGQNKIAVGLGLALLYLQLLLLGVVAGGIEVGLAALQAVIQ